MVYGDQNQFYNAYYPGQMYVPQTPNLNQMYQTANHDNRFVWVQGKEGAKAYPTAPNNTLIFLDDQEPYVYKKTTDREGKTVDFKIYRLVEEVDQETQSKTESEFVTRDDFNALSNSIFESINDLKGMIRSSNNRPYQGKKVNSNG